MNFLKSVALLLVMVTGSQAVASTTNPHHYLWVALQNGVRKTVDGERTYQQARRMGFVKPLFHCFVEGGITLNACSEDFHVKPYISGKSDEYVYIHADVMGRSFEERVDVIKAALEAYIEENRKF